MKLDPSMFAGKTIFVGIDVHKATYSVAIVVDGEIVFKIGSMPAEPQKLLELLQKRFPQSTIRSAYEAGFSGFVLHRALTAAGIGNIVVHASSIAVASNDRVKTDKRDAAKIALHLSRGMLRGIRIPTVEEELKRQLSRTRAQLVKERSRLACQIKSKLMQFGFIALSDKRTMTRPILEEFKQLSLPMELGLAISVLAEIWEKLSEQIKELEIEMSRQASNEPTLEKRYRSVPGIGPITSRILSNELGDMSQFPNIRHIYSFVGLTPSEHSSGERERKGHISRQGAARLRGALVEAAWVAIGKDPELATVYARLKTRRGGKRAIVAVARRLIGRIRACVRNGADYQLSYADNPTP